MKKIRPGTRKSTRLRHSATMALFERKDVIIVASVSCITAGDPEDYSTMGLSLRPGEEIDRDTIIEKLVNMQYMRNDMNFTRDTFPGTGRYHRRISCIRK